VRPLPGIKPAGHLNCLIEQLVESRRRIEFTYHLRDARHDPGRINPASPLFDPLKAAVLHYRRGRVDEAYWLVFLAVHFGKAH
jgi:Alpha-glutamyl/putrescinyl thymine pyrophosphorylase clade 3